MDLSESVSNLLGVGDVVAKKLASLNIFSINDLLKYYPRRYDDYSNIVTINNASPGIVSIKGTISNIVSRYSRKGLHITEAIVSDKTGSMRLIWFNQPYRAASIKPESIYYVSGEFGLNHQRFSMVNPGVELESNFPINTARIVPVYKETKGFKSHQIRKLIKACEKYIEAVNESLPKWIVKNHNLIDKPEAIMSMHFPKDIKSLETAKRRLGFEEVFELSLAALINKYELKAFQSVSIKFDQTLAKKFVSSLPFKLSDEQRAVVWQIYKDIEQDLPMNRLLEGDVGTGKTVVATMAAVMALKQGYQVAFMAPTEILARQHGETIYELLKPLNMENELSLLMGGMAKKEKDNALDGLRKGRIKFIVGTHSLISEKVNLSQIGLAIIDEQHRFGVKQRQQLLDKAGHMPHILSMTATPIPRSLQLTLYGELDVSIIKHKPYQSVPTITKIVSLNQRTALYKKLKEKLDKGTQAYVVCPFIVENDDLPFRSAEKVYEELKKGVFKDKNIQILHSKLKTDEKDKIMDDYINNKIDVLVSTTIIEVGVNVVNASIMVIESAERFGLAQIHQLRGRVGRSKEQGYCYLVLDSNEEPNPRLSSIENTLDGFKLAELDLKLRGPGAIYGHSQHGQLDLRVARLDDMDLIIEARDTARTFIDKKENLLQYKELHHQVERLRSITNLN